MGATGQAFPRRFGKYTLLAHLATGGMADVYLARQLGPAGFEKECVIKRILPHLALDPNNQSFIDMFLDEARIAARLSHPNIVHIFDLGQVDGDHYLALEYVDGITIESILDRLGQTGQSALPWPIAVRIVSNVAEGLEHAHKAKDGAGNPLLLVHRDISPSNIMVSWDGVAKILDFGIAKAMSVSSAKVKTGVGIIKGKVPYMSPEQIQGLDLDGRSDIFSLGVVLYEMTTGKRPFPGETTGQLTVQITSREPLQPETLNPAFPRDLWPVLMRAMAKSVDKRYQSARDFKLDLEQFLADQLVSCTNYDVEAYLRELVPERPRPKLPSPEEIAAVEAAAEQSNSYPGSYSGVSGGTGTTPSLGVNAASMSSSPTAPSTATPSEPAAPALHAAGSAQRPTQADFGNAGRRPKSADQSSGPGIDVLEAENAAEQRRHRQSGGSGKIMGAIALLVIATAVIFYLLHEQAVEKTDQPIAAAAVDAAVPAAVPAPKTPTPPVAKGPEAAAGTTAGSPTPQSAGATPAENTQKTATPTPPPEKKASEAKPEAKPETAEKSEKAQEASDSDSKPKPKPKRQKKHEEEEAPSDISKLPLPPPPPPDPS